MTIRKTGLLKSELLPGQRAALSLPPTIFQRFNDSANVGAFYGIYETVNLFPIQNVRTANESSTRQTRVCSTVLTATVGNDVEIENITENVQIAFRLQTKDGLVRRLMHTYIMLL